MQNIKLFVNVGKVGLDKNYRKVDLFKDETIELSNKLTDIEKLANIFQDSTNTFTIPSTPNNDIIFKHYYDFDVDDVFNTNIKVEAYLEVDGYLFRYGKVQLEGCRKIENMITDYKISFYGSTIQLSDLFGEDTIDRLDYNKNGEKIFTNLSDLNYEYNGANFYKTINDSTFKNGDIITPLISYTDRNWEYGGGTPSDISKISTAIKNNELRPAIRNIKIFEAIEEKYGITFSRDFLGSGMFSNLYMWMNKKEDGILGINEVAKITTPLTGSPNAGNITLQGDYIKTIRRRNTQNANVIFKSSLSYVVTPTNTTYKYDAFMVDINGKIIKQWLNQNGVKTFSKVWSSNYLIYGSETAMVEDNIKLMILPAQSNTFSVNVNATYGRYIAGLSPDIYTNLNSNTNITSLNIMVIVEENLTSMKVIDYLGGIMKMFKLIIRPITPTSFYIDTLDSYYKKGDIIDITDYVDLNDVTITKPQVYKEVNFKFEKTSNILGAKFRQMNDRNDEVGYGDLKSEFETEDKSKLDVKLPFENMLFERLTNLVTDVDTKIVIGKSISTSDNGVTFSLNKGKPIMFFNNGFTNLNTDIIRLKFNNAVDATIQFIYNIGNTNDYYIDQVTNSINWGAEVDPWHNEVITKSLYKEFWSNWMETVYDRKQRKINYSAVLPTPIINLLSLNDKLLISGDRFKINTLKVNLNTNVAKFELIKDIFEWTSYDFPLNLDHSSYKFNDGWYYTDYQEYNNQIYIYGNFTTYGGESFGRIIRLNADGSFDSTYNVGGVGFDTNLYNNQSILKLSDDKIIVTGEFTSYNGVTRNRIVKLNVNGSYDTTFNVGGAGFNNYTLGTDVTTDNKIVITGLFNTYNGIPYKRLVRIDNNGAIDYTLSIGTGFNNTTTDVNVLSDKSMVVVGYFTNYDGTSINRIIKLNENGSVNSVFSINVGTGLNSTTNQPSGLLRGLNDLTYVYGWFTQYNGLNHNRMFRFSKIGTVDKSFTIGNGFNNFIEIGKIVMYDKMLMSGAFTEFNGLPIEKNILLNSDGSINTTFGSQYTNVFAIGSVFYGNELNGGEVIIADETLPTLSVSIINAVASNKYYDIDILKEGDWTVSKLDVGYGTDWVNLTNTTDYRQTIQVLDRQEGLAPGAFDSTRYMDILFNFNGVYRSVRVSQIGQNI